MIRVGASLLAYVADTEAKVHMEIFVKDSYYESTDFNITSAAADCKY